MRISDWSSDVCSSDLASLAQTVVEPHMTTAFGMLSMMHYDAATGATEYLNGSMNAPLAGLGGITGADLTTGRGVAVPGFWAAWAAARQRHATKSREELAAPATELARTGIPIYPGSEERRVGKRWGRRGGVRGSAFT